MSSSYGGDGNQGKQEVPEHPDGDNHDEEEDKESPSGANEQKKEDEDDTVLPARCTPAIECLSLTSIKKWKKCSSD